LVPSAGEHSKFDCESVRGGRITTGVSIVSSASGRERAVKQTPPQAISVSDRGAVVEAEEKMIIEGAWVLVIAVVVFSATVAVVLIGSGKLYDLDRSHE
jgi:hypothetical protein